MTTGLLRPPAPRPLGPLGTALRILAQRRLDILGALPRRAYENQIGWRPVRGRTIYLVNDPRAARDIMVDAASP